MNYRFILAIDPSGAYHEGKGTTGWCIYDCKKQVCITTGIISANDFPSMEAYWDKHCDLITYYREKHRKQLFVVIEDFFLYAQKAEAQINSRMETSKLIGVLQHFCWERKQPYAMQPAAEAKPRWTDDILVYKQIIEPYNRGYCLNTPAGPVVISKHQIDAVRHAVHYATFKNKGE